jgi:hypothetical protein
VGPAPDSRLSGGCRKGGGLRCDRFGQQRRSHPSVRQLLWCCLVQDRSERNLSIYATIEAFAREQGIDFYPAGRGIGHQVGPFSHSFRTKFRANRLLPAS